MTNQLRHETMIGASVKLCMGIVKVIRGSTAAMRDAVHLDQAEWHADSAGKHSRTCSSQPFLAPPAHMPPCSDYPELGMDPVS